MCLIEALFHVGHLYKHKLVRYHISFVDFITTLPVFVICSIHLSVYGRSKNTSMFHNGCRERIDDTLWTSIDFGSRWLAAAVDLLSHMWSFDSDMLIRNPRHVPFGWYLHSHPRVCGTGITPMSHFCRAALLVPLKTATQGLLWYYLSSRNITSLSLGGSFVSRQQSHAGVSYYITTCFADVLPAAAAGWSRWQKGLWCSLSNVFQNGALYTVSSSLPQAGAFIGCSTWSKILSRSPHV